jgi:hypothetical protein
MIDIDDEFDKFLAGNDAGSGNGSGSNEKPASANRINQS